MELNKIYQGDCLSVMKDFPDNSIDAIVTDPPYGLSFMGKKWDYDVPSQQIWEECLRVLKPGGYLLAFAGTRTQHRMAVRIEDAGFEIRDMIAWVYGSGFPKSLNIGKAVDKINGEKREVIREEKEPLRQGGSVNWDMRSSSSSRELTIGSSEWEGWGTALKPALEPITVARKPLSEKTVAENCLRWGVGGINIDGCRVEHKESIIREQKQTGALKFKGDVYQKSKTQNLEYWENTQGRFPANLIWSCDCKIDLETRIDKLNFYIKKNEGSLDIGIEEWNKILEWKNDLEKKRQNSFHFDDCEVVSLFPNSKAGKNKEQKGTGGIWSESSGLPCGPEYGDNGSASRFFYCAKSSKSERNSNGAVKNTHATVKPLKLMEYLVKLVSREGAVVLDPFTGSGSTLIACKNLNRNYIGIEMDAEYVKIAEARLSAVKKKNTLF